MAFLACSEGQGNLTSTLEETPDFVNGKNIANGRTTDFIPVAKIDPANGKVTVLTQNLIKKFKDGGPIKYFGVRKTNASYGFVRMGYDINGNYKSETFATEIKSNIVGVTLYQSVAWIILCDGTCFGCMGSPDGSSCDCGTNLEIEGGTITVVDDAGNEIDADDLDNPGGVCAAGSGGSSIHPNQVFH